MTKIGEAPALGFTLWQAAQLTTRAFDRVLAAHGGNRPIWFILLALDAGTHTTQRTLAAEVGINDATLTHHLSGLEERGLIRRARSQRDRRVQHIEFTDAGRDAFEAMRDSALAFDQELRSRLGAGAADDLRSALMQLTEVVSDAERTPLRAPTDSDQRF